MGKLVKASILPCLYYWELYNAVEADDLVEDLRSKADTLGINIELFLCPVTGTQFTINAVFLSPEDASTFREAYFS